MNHPTPPRFLSLAFLGALLSQLLNQRWYQCVVLTVKAYNYVLFSSSNLKKNQKKTKQQQQQWG